MLSSAKTSAPVLGTRVEGHEEQESSKDSAASWEAVSREIRETSTSKEILGWQGEEGSALR